MPRRDSFLIGFQVVFSVYDFEVGSCVQIIAQILIALHTLYLSPDHEDLTCEQISQICMDTNLNTSVIPMHGFVLVTHIQVV